MYAEITVEKQQVLIVQILQMPFLNDEIYSPIRSILEDQNFLFFKSHIFFIQQHSEFISTNSHWPANSELWVLTYEITPNAAILAPVTGLLWNVYFCPCF